MKSRRTAKIEQAVLQSVSSAILFGLKDPRIRNVTVVRVEVSPDIRSAKVYVSVMGDEKVQSLCMHGLNSARGYLQAKVADRLQTRYTPVLRFVLDQSIKKSAEASRILREVLPETAESDEDAIPHAAEEDAIDDRNTAGAESDAEHDEGKQRLSPREKDSTAENASG